MQSNIYNPSRQYHFVLRQFSMYQNRWLIAASAVFGLLLIISLLVAYFNPEDLINMRPVYLVAFFIGGFIFSSQIFMELNSPQRSYSFFTLPVSALEKLTAAWFISSPFYVLLFNLVTYGIYLISFVVAERPLSEMDFFFNEYWRIISAYIVLQTVFLWGACYFKSFNFLKTLLCLVILVTALGLYSAGLGWLLLENSTKVNGSAEEIKNFMNNIFAPSIDFFFWFVFGPYMLVTSYFTLKERQV